MSQSGWTTSPMKSELYATFAKCVACDACHSGGIYKKYSLYIHSTNLYQMLSYND